VLGHAAPTTATTNTPPATSDIRELRFRRDVERVWRLGPRAQYELLSELAARHTLRTEIEQLVARYSRVDPEVVRRTAGDRMPPTPLTLLPRRRR
jgi:hypothetical protein